MPLLSAFYPYVVPTAPGVPDFTVDRVLVDAAIQFCRDTLIWVADIDPVPLVPGTDAYELFADANADVLAVLDARVRSGSRTTALHRSTPRQQYEMVGQSGAPTSYNHAISNTISVFPASQAAGTLECVAALQPKAGATTLPDMLYQDWRETIGAGAASRLLMVYGDLRMASTAEMVYLAGVSRANAQRQVGRQRTPLRSTPVP